LADVIIIGGGIAGSTTAYYLAADGIDVTLLEQHDLNTLASTSNAGSLHAQIQPEPFVEFGESWARRFLPAVPFYIESMALWQDIQIVLGKDLEVTQEGGLVVAANDLEMRAIEAKAKLERSVGLEMELLTAGELRDRAPYISKTMIGGALCAIEGKANSLIAAPSFAAAARDLGATLLKGQRVIGIQRNRAGFQIQTDDLSLEATHIVNTAGLEAGVIAAMLGYKIDVQSFPIQLSVTEPVAPLFRHLVYSGSEMLTLKQTGKGTILIGGGWPSALDSQRQPQVTSASLYGNLRVALQTVPDIASARIVRTWAAQVNGNESWLPLIGEMPGADGFFINYVPWMGFSGAPAAGRIVASLVQGREPPVDFDVSPFKP